VRGAYYISGDVDLSVSGLFTGRRCAKSFVSRKCHEPGGFGYMLRKGAGEEPLVLPPDAAGYRVMFDGSFEWVTWKEIHEARSKRQAEELQRKRRSRGERWPKRAQLWVFRNEGWLYSGWHVYVRYWVQPGEWNGPVQYVNTGYKGRWDESRLRDLMARIPMGVAGDQGWLFPRAFWEVQAEWCEALAKAHPKRKSKEDPRRAGILNGWTDGVSFYLSREEAARAADGTDNEERRAA
jgi:hypothetical protein